jgi:hypothetical protein
MGLDITVQRLKKETIYLLTLKKRKKLKFLHSFWMSEI